MNKLTKLFSLKQKIHINIKLRICVNYESFSNTGISNVWQPRFEKIWKICQRLVALFSQNMVDLGPNVCETTKSEKNEISVEVAYLHIIVWNIDSFIENKYLFGNIESSWFEQDFDIKKKCVLSSKFFFQNLWMTSLIF